MTARERRNSPIVGLTASTHPRRGIPYLAADVNAVRQAGAIPVLLPPDEDVSELEDVHDRLDISARAQDAVIEAVEVPDHPFALGVQWHPERITDRDPHAAFFKRFAAACRGRSAGRC